MKLYLLGRLVPRLWLSMVIHSNALPAKKTSRGSQTRSGFCAASQILMCWPLGGPGVVVGWLVVCCLRCGGLKKKRRYNLNVYTLACIASLFDKNGELNSNLGDWPVHLSSKNHNHGIPRLPCPYQWCMLYLPEWMVDFNGTCRDILTGLGKHLDVLNFVGVLLVAWKTSGCLCGLWLILAWTCWTWFP